MKYLTILLAAIFTAASINLLIKRNQIRKFYEALNELNEVSKRTQELTCELEQDIDECWQIIEDYKKGQ